MKSEIKDIILPFFLSLLVLIFLEIFGTTMMPIIGLQNYMIPFHVLIVLYLGFKLQTPYISILILIVQYVHSFFTVSGWEVGTIAGILICVLISYLRELLHFTSAIMTIFVTQLFQTVWFVLVSGLLLLREVEYSFIVEKFWRFLPESLIMSLLAPFIFALLDRVWRVSSNGALGEES